jgi:23S rRNA (cytosine1962-C5)-methyltransferase
MNTPYACINSRGLERLQAGHLWIYRSDVASCDAPPGSIVSLYAPKKRFVGKAFYSADSLITLRLLTVKEQEVDRIFWTDRLYRAWQLRQRVVVDSEVYRLVHGEGDGLPSIIVDRYGEVLSLQTLSQGAEQVKPLLTEILIELFHPSCVIERNDSRVRELEGLPLQSSILYGSDPGELVCRENGLRFCYHPLSGQKTGAFLDQRENRVRASRLASGKALDCFCYAGGFAVHLARSCEEVEAFDLSETAIRMAHRNAELNGLANLHFEIDNVFDRLRLYDNLKKRFDTIVLDPPAFAKSRSQVAGALRGYKEINLRALRLLNPGGLLVTSTCSQHVDETTFLNLLSEAAADGRRKVQVVHKATQGQDHPFLLSMPETLYLKCLFLRVIE